MAAQKREGYGRIPNCLVKSGAWAMFDKRMQAVYVALVALLDRIMSYTDNEGTWRVSCGHPTLMQIAKASGVRRADIPRITDIFDRMGLIIKRKATINRKERRRYILPPPDHPMSCRLGDSCVRIYQELGKTWGLSRKWGRSQKPHQSPVRRLPYESPTRRLSTDIHSSKNKLPTIVDSSGRRMGGPPAQDSALHSASPPNPLLPLRKLRWSQFHAAREGMNQSHLVTLFAESPPETWEHLTTELQAAAIRWRDIEEAKRIATGVVPNLPPLKRPRGEVSLERGIASSQKLEGKRPRCEAISRSKLRCALRALPSGSYCISHQSHDKGGVKGDIL